MADYGLPYEEGPFLTLPFSPCSDHECYSLARTLSFTHGSYCVSYCAGKEVDPESALSLTMLGPYSPLTFLSVLSLMIFYAATLNILLKLTKLQAALCCLQVCDFPHGELPVFMRMADLSDPCLSFSCFSFL